MALTLGQLRKQQRGRILSITSDGPIVGRLLAMGILPGQKVRVVGIAPLGDPIMVQMEGCRLSLRREEADHLAVEPITN